MGLWRKDKHEKEQSIWTIYLRIFGFSCFCIHFYRRCVCIHQQFYRYIYTTLGKMFCRALWFLCRCIVCFDCPKCKTGLQIKILFWLSRNFPKLFIGWFLLVLALSSAKGKPAWEVNTVYDILSLQWTIWGLSLAIFLVWDGIVIAYLKRNQPEELDPTNPFQKCRFLLRKESFYRRLSPLFRALSFLTVNLFLLLFSTIQIYLKAQPDSVFTQSVLYCSFFFTTNSIAGMFLDILKHLNREKI